MSIKSDKASEFTEEEIDSKVRDVIFDVDQGGVAGAIYTKNGDPYHLLRDALKKLDATQYDINETGNLIGMITVHKIKP